MYSRLPKTVFSGPAAPKTPFVQTSLSSQPTPLVASVSASGPSLQPIKKSYKKKKTAEELLRDQAFDLYRAKKYKDAIQVFKQIPGRQIEDLVGMARCYIDMLDNKSAFEILLPLELGEKWRTPEEKMRVLITLARALSHQAVILKKQPQLAKESSQFLEQANTVLRKIDDQTHWDVVYAQIKLLEVEGKEDEAILKCKKNIERHPLYFQTFIVYAIILRNQEDFTGSLKVLAPFAKELHLIRSQFSSLRPKGLSVSQILLAMNYRDQGKKGMDKAFYFARKAIEADPTYALAYTVLGKIYQLRNKLGDIALATECFQRSYELDQRRFERRHGGSVSEHKSIVNADAIGGEDDIDSFGWQILRQLESKHAPENAMPRVSGRDAWYNEGEPEVKKTQRPETKRRAPRKWDEGLDEVEPTMSLISGGGFSAFLGMDPESDREEEEDIAAELPLDESKQVREVKSVKQPVRQEDEKMVVTDQTSEERPAEVFLTMSAEALTEVSVKTLTVSAEALTEVPVKALPVPVEVLTEGPVKALAASAEALTNVPAKASKDTPPNPSPDTPDAFTSAMIASPVILSEQPPVVLFEPAPVTDQREIKSASTTHRVHRLLLVEPLYPQNDSRESDRHNEETEDKDYASSKPIVLSGQPKRSESQGTTLCNNISRAFIERATKIRNLAQGYFQSPTPQLHSDEQDQKQSSGLSATSSQRVTR